MAPTSVLVLMTIIDISYLWYVLTDTGPSPPNRYYAGVLPLHSGPPEESGFALSRTSGWDRARGTKFGCNQRLTGDRIGLVYTEILAPLNGIVIPPANGLLVVAGVFNGSWARRAGVDHS